MVGFIFFVLVAMFALFIYIINRPSRFEKEQEKEQEESGWVDITKEREQEAEQSWKALEQVRSLLNSKCGLTLNQLQDIVPKDYRTIQREILALYREGKLERKKDFAGTYHYRYKKEDAE